jgi:anti-anti-sigma factor
MYIFYIRHPTYAIIRVEGKIEGYHAEKFQRPFLELNQIGCHNIIVNFEQTLYISSSILGILIEQWRNIQEHHGSFSVCSLSESVADIFRITNLSSRIAVYETEQQASEMFLSER